MKYKAVIYDIDGTILNTLNMNMIPLIQIIKEEIGEEWSFERVLKYASYPGLKVIEELGVENPELTYQRWVQYVNEFEGGASLYDGFLEVFDTFDKQGIIQAVVSAKTRTQYAIDMESKGYNRYMKVEVLADDINQAKPSPESLYRCLELLDMQAHEVIYIGDAVSDYEAASSAGIDFGYARWGSTSSEGIVNPDYVFEKPIDILNLLTEE